MLPKISGEKAIKTLERMGFRRARQRGSHVVMKRVAPSGTTGCSIPLHRELKVGTLAGILRQAKVEQEDFLKYL